MTHGCKAMVREGVTHGCKAMVRGTVLCRVQKQNYFKVVKLLKYVCHKVVNLMRYIQLVYRTSLI